MHVVINIPDELYSAINEDTYGVHRGRIYDIIRNGTALPKGHGRLIDTIKLTARMFDLPQQPEGSYWDGVDAVGKLIDEADTIIEADKESEKENG